MSQSLAADVPASFTAKAVILATGTSARILGIPGERELTGQGVAYCATCDAAFFQDQHVVVVGSGDQAIEEGLFLTKYASRVTVVVLHEQGVLDCNRQSAEKALAHPKMEFLWNSTVVRVEGSDHVTGVTIRDSRTGSVYKYPCNGVFFFVGMIPATGFLQDSLPLNRQGWIVTNDRMETTVGGVFAAGDVREKYLRQITTAAADGATAATAAERYIEEMNDFEQILMPSEKPVVLAFWDPARTGSLEAVMQLKASLTDESVQFMEVDVSRKKFLASHFGVVLSEKQPAAIRTLHGQKEANLPLFAS
ncbi:MULTISPECIES: NAD(P)/FAD-dependent oxidoreductase [Caproicibacterium]|uniref:FAD-dependent oxidoreductase n=1 Tax=Caproicibacterium argilliputei TaxID=3030016 RepID=A0AA97D9Q6_9FIRM|nr:FAD-dependent oxidoreductase [Caproicibacterium argilliputei]WOC31613.1 FAD-dependent oxidoreductase [Caproicibacterium argilliputei]